MKEYVAQYTITLNVSKKIEAENMVDAATKAMTTICTLGLNLDNIKFKTMHGAEIEVDVDDFHVEFDDIYDKTTLV